MSISDETNNEVAAKGISIYNDRLKAILEPQHNDEFVVIHVDNGDFVVSKRRWEATQKMHSRYGIGGRLLAMRIGSAPEYGLAYYPTRF